MKGRQQQDCTLRKLRMAGLGRGGGVAKKGSNWGGQRWEAVLSNTIYRLQSSPQDSPRARFQAMPSLRRSAPCPCCSQGGEHSGATMNALRGLLRSAGNCGHREFGFKSGFVFRVTPIWQNSDYSTSKAQARDMVLF